MKSTKHNSILLSAGVHFPLMFVSEWIVSMYQCPEAGNTGFVCHSLQETLASLFCSIHRIKPIRTMSVSMLA